MSLKNPPRIHWVQSLHMKWCDPFPSKCRQDTRECLRPDLKSRGCEQNEGKGQKRPGRSERLSGTMMLQTMTSFWDTQTHTHTHTQVRSTYTRKHMCTSLKLVLVPAYAPGRHDCLSQVHMPSIHQALLCTSHATVCNMHRFSHLRKSFFFLVAAVVKCLLHQPEDARES